MMKKFCLLVLLMGSTLYSGCVIEPVNPADTSGLNSPGVMPERIDGTTPSGLGAYTLKPSDPIYIRFSGILEQETLEKVIDEKGEITLLHLDAPIKAAGLTTSELEQKIEQAYVDGGIYNTVAVTVTMTAKVFYVQGEVNAPGQFQLASGTTLLQAIAGARGYNPYASNKITITRQGRIHTFNRKELERDPSKDVLIEAGDVIKVWQSWY